MSKVEKKQNRDLKHLTNIAMTSVLVALLLMLPILGNAIQNETNYLTKLKDVTFDYSWKISDERGEDEVAFPLKLSSDIKETTITNTLPAVMDNTELVFYHQTQWLAVDIDGKTVYETQTAKIADSKSSAGTYIITVPMFSSYAGKDIVVHMTRFDTGQAMSIGDIKITSHYGLIAAIMKENALNLMLLLIMAMGALFCGIYRIHLVRNSGIIDKRINKIFTNLGLFFIAGGMWMITDREILGLVTGQPVICGMMIYYFFTLLPILFINLLTAIFDKDYLYLRIFKYLFFVDILLQAVLFVYGLVDLHSMLPVTHVLLIALVLCVAVHLVKNGSVEKLMSKRFVFVGAIVLGVFVILGVVAFHIDINLDYMTIVFLGMVIFEISLMVYACLAVKEKVKQYNEQVETEKFTFIDGLTGLENRKAFDKELKQIDESNTDTDHMLVIMDVDGLRAVNELEGHDKGDELILKAAECIKEIYDELGKCYRISADEFAVIIKEWKGNFAAVQRKLRQLSAEKKITIAGGAGHIIDEQGFRKSIREWRQEAELNMLADKTERNIGSMRDNKSSLMNVVENLVAQTENKITGMQGHSEVVKRLSIFIASKLYFSVDEMEDLVMAAKFHDVGLVGVPDTVLLKHDELTKDEYELVKKHSEIGDSAFASAPGCQNVGRIIRAHHERYNGSGYPDRLKGEDIPAGARIIAIADAIDAITSERSFRDANDSQYCYEELEKNAGIMFDPEMIKRVLENWSEVEDILMVRDKQRQVIQNPNKYDVI